MHVHLLYSSCFYSPNIQRYTSHTHVYKVYLVCGGWVIPVVKRYAKHTHVDPVYQVNVSNVIPGSQMYTIYIHLYLVCLVYNRHFVLGTSDQRIVIFPANRNCNRFAETTSV